ncbi:glycerol-3-phosphate 1-O-acyltransferase PlsY [Humisphaera borealis]|uniref:Glycerol-3-phosphate acyltransferase n=1 Tax=Humisphaera borealis TaxID=2807512 RepID=A0A7M2WQF8_9BACT|nr:glycerol-3-phosphate 1-O-acyltransferase PlsY [Humisphaera borealis]QOV87686.1 glycerol-3-phosphate 1-O-acyltransferase PlsY [Humisphaera borealis]
MTPPQQTLLYLIPVAYLVGSVPFGLIVGKMRGIDVRTAGSGNIGATNVGRLLGAKYFALVFVLDMLKGLGPMVAAGGVLGFVANDSLTYLLWLAVGFTAILGHMFSVFLKFKGGKGVATSAGVVLGLFPYFTLPAATALAIWGALFGRTKIVSLASIAAAIAFPLVYLGFAIAGDWHPFGEQLPLLLFSLLMAAMIVLRHRTNISRLRAGTEHRFGKIKPTTNGDRLASGNGESGDAHGHSRA